MPLTAGLPKKVVFLLYAEIAIDLETRMEDSKTYFLQPGYILASQDLHLIHIVLGSCVAVCLWDSYKNFGGACHFIYPTATHGEANGRFGGIAIPHLLHLMQDLGSDLTLLKAHVIGGATNINSPSNLGNDNISIAEAVLAKYRIKIVTKEVGGTFGRKVIFHSMTGKVLVYQTDDIRQSDWYE
jgi:chemotaxis protein CheD